MSVLVQDDVLAGFTLAAGFHCAATACGLKKSGAQDLALVWTPSPCSAAGVFTTNRVQAAPVVLNRATLRASSSRIRAVIANAGCANAVTGSRGLADARRMAALAGQAVGAGADEVLVLSTGVIGVHLDMAKVERGIAAFGTASPPGGAGPAVLRSAADAARAITTTDTRPKVATLVTDIGGHRVTVSGFAKGAGMIHPRMATMLAVVTTDAAIDPVRLDRSLRSAVERSFNRITVDGDMSTNDTVLVLASGAAGARVGEVEEAAFTRALTEVCGSLARQVARDGEGATRLVEIRVTGAGSERQAHRVGDAIACSPLVKTAIHGSDPNWGRVLAAAGYSGEEIDPEAVRLWFGEADQVQLLDHGQPLAFDAARASTLLAVDPTVIRLDLGLGTASATVWTCDLSAEYVRVNAEYTT